MDILSGYLSFLFIISLHFITLPKLSFSLPSTNDLSSSNSAKLSVGCAYSQLPDGMRTDELTLKKINIADPRLNGVIERQFYVRVPGRQEDVIMIYPDGMSDFTFENGTAKSDLKGWNAVGSSENKATGCFMPHGLSQCGFQSCKQLKQCNPCGFASCHNDILFVQKILEWAYSSLCVDKSRVFATGLSNGGLMTYEIISRYPDPFQAFIVVYGSPLEGFLNFSNPRIVGKPLLHIHGLNDIWVPFNGTLNIQNYTFTPVIDVIEEYARIQRCSLYRTIWETPFDTVNDFQCMQYPRCQSGATVVLCTYSGGHDYPPMIEETTYLFIRRINNDETGYEKMTGSKTYLQCSAFFVFLLLSGILQIN